MKGYNLFELLIVLLILSIVAVFAVPSLQQSYLLNRAKTEVDQLVRVLNFARTQAIITADSTLVCPIGQNIFTCGNDWSNGITVFKVKNGKYDVIKQMHKFSRAKLTWNRSSNKIVFNDTGFLQSQNGSFSYEIDSGSKLIKQKVIVSRTGRVRVE